MEAQVDKRRITLSRRLLAAVVLTTSLATFITSAVQFFLEYRDEAASLDDALVGFEKTALPSIAKFSWNMDQKALEEVVHSALAVREFATITAVDMDGVVLSKVEKPGMEKYEIKSKEFDVKSNEGAVFGHIQVRYTRSFIFRKLQLHAIEVFSTNFLKSIVVSFLLLAYFQHQVVRPIIELSEHFRGLLDPNMKFAEVLKLSRKHSRRDEFDDVVQGVNDYESKMRDLGAQQEELIARQEDLVKARTANMLSKSDQLTTAIEAIPGFVVWFDDGLNMLGSNKRWLASQWHGRDNKGHPVLFLDPENDVQLRSVIAGFDAGSSDTVQYETMVEREDKSVQFMVSVSRLHQDGGFMVIGMDTTDAMEARQKIEAERTDMQLKLAHSARLASLGTIGAGVAHELNNPLAAIRGFSEILAKHPEDAKKTLDYSNKIHDATIRMHKIVSELHSFSREGTTKNYVALNINTIARQAFVTYEAQYAEKNIAADFSLLAVLPAVLGDSSELESVISNLFANSRDAFDGIKDGRQKKVRVHSHINSAGMVQLNFSDNAGGMPEHVMKRIFDPFFTTKDIGKGTGLGMSIVRGIIDRHKASIEVRSVIGDGTTFQLVFVASGLTAAPVIVPVVAPLPAMAAVPVFGHKRIMVVDDEPLLAELIEIYLAESYSVQTFSNPLAALAAFSPGKFDAVITDVRMPGISGPELLAKIFMLAPGFPALIMSGDSANLPQVLDLVNGRNCQFIQKPFADDGGLLAKLASVLEGGVQVQIVPPSVRKHIMIVDDEPMLTELIVALLEDQYEVSAFNDPVAAVAGFNPSIHALVVVDMNMPGLSGAEVLAKIRSAAPDAPTIIMSGHSVEDSCVQDIIAQFQCGYLAKPSDGGAILKAVAAALAKHKGPAAIAA